MPFESIQEALLTDGLSPPGRSYIEYAAVVALGHCNTFVVAVRFGKRGTL